SEAKALLRLVEAVAEVEIGPAVSGGDGLVHLYVEVAERLDVGGRFVRIVEAVVGLGQALLAGGDNLAGGVIGFQTTPGAMNGSAWEREGIKAIRRGVIKIRSHC